MECIAALFSILFVGLLFTCCKKVCDAGEERRRKALEPEQEKDRLMFEEEIRANREYGRQAHKENEERKMKQKKENNLIQKYYQNYFSIARDPNYPTMEEQLTNGLILQPINAVEPIDYHEWSQNDYL